ncbi:MAG TPA: hypothetical protein VFI37_16045 [Gaiellaceae bacterium]|nr:hypothetical protein [Gaiellaceae bacterium]
MTTLPDSLVRFEDELARAIRRDRARRPRRLAIRLAAAGVAAAAVALGILSILPGGGPSAVDRAAAALGLDSGSILHVDMTGRQVNADGSVATWEDESWQQTSKPYARRQVETSSHGPRAESLSAGGTEQLYDATTNTIYQAPPPAAPDVEAGPDGKKYVILPKSDGTTAKKLVTVGEAPKLRTVAPVAAKPETPFRDEILALLHSGKASEQGHETVDGRDAIRIVSPGGVTTYLVDARTYDPIRFVTRKGADSVTLEFETYEQLPAAGNEGLLNLTAQHPDARVDDGADAYRQAQARLYPHG